MTPCAHDFDTWLPKLSDRGVVLLHDTNCRERDFGVWRLWDELRQAYPHFAFVHGHGLGLLAVGRGLPPPIGRLFELPPDRAVRFRQFYFRLGRQIEEGYERTRLIGDVRTRADEIVGLRAGLSAAEDRAASAEAQAGELRRQVEDRDQTIASLRLPWIGRPAPRRTANHASRTRASSPASRRPSAAWRRPARWCSSSAGATPTCSTWVRLAASTSRRRRTAFTPGPTRRRARWRSSSWNRCARRWVRFLAVPATAFWWFEHYADFARHLEARYQRVWADSHCVVYRLRAGAAGAWHRLRRPGRAPADTQGERVQPRDRRRITPETRVTRHHCLPARFGRHSGPGGSFDRRGGRRRQAVPPTPVRTAIPADAPAHPTPGRADPSHSRLNWLVPDFGPGMGGPAVIFRMIGLLEALGHRSTIWVCGRTRCASAEEARASVAEHFQPLAADVRFLPDACGPEVLAGVRGDAVIATHYRTAYVARSDERPRAVLLYPGLRAGVLPGRGRVPAGGGDVPLWVLLHHLGSVAAARAPDAVRHAGGAFRLRVRPGRLPPRSRRGAPAGPRGILRPARNAASPGGRTRRDGTGTRRGSAPGLVVDLFGGNTRTSDCRSAMRTTGCSRRRDWQTCTAGRPWGWSSRPRIIR